MRCNLHCKLLILFVTVSLCALSASLVVRNLIIGDFRQYQDGEYQDRIQRVIGQLEGNFDQHGGWKLDPVAIDLAWILQTGFEARLHATDGTVVLNTADALEVLNPAMRKRVLETSSFETEQPGAPYISYPLFLQGREIGQLDLRPLHSIKEDFFISSSNRFLYISMLLLGVVSLFISVIASRRLTIPILELTRASTAIAAGNHSSRASLTGNDELGQLALSFNRMADTIETGEHLRRRLLSGAAHELRTPLAIISGELEGMIDGVLPVNSEALVSMHDEARRLTAILNGVDEMTRAESASLRLDSQVVVLKPFLEAISDRFSALFSEKKGVLLLDCPETCNITADPDRLSQIVINLISNALKAIESGGLVSITVRKDFNELQIEVTDNGHGIDEEDLPHIFERFYKRDGNGLGLGLSIVKELVAAHGWQMKVNSRAGLTVFKIVAPYTAR